jgi:hypothetical protein
MAYFPTRADAQDATLVLHVFFKVLPPHMAAEPLNGRPWEITILVNEGGAEETLYVSPELWDQMIRVVVSHGGQVRTAARRVG